MSPPERKKEAGRKERQLTFQAGWSRDCRGAGVVPTHHSLPPPLLQPLQAQDLNVFLYTSVILREFPCPFLHFYCSDFTISYDRFSLDEK
jgi:hypothetical protein